MAIEGLRTVPERPISVILSNNVDTNVEALDTLGLVEDRDQVTESVTREFVALDHAGRTGEAYIALPRGLITLEDLIDVSDSGNYNGKRYRESYVYHELWTPGTIKGSYKADMLDNLTFGVSDGNFPVHARLAVHRGENQDERLLHFLNMPYDGAFARGRKTQLEAIDEAITAYEAEGHEDFVMTPLNAKAIAYIGLVRRINGEYMPLERGCMRDGTLRRKKVGGEPVVGDVSFSGGRLLLVYSDGYSDSKYGVGLSVGPKVQGVDLEGSK
jgi:hypothetical protein